jgi:hypothetical protein
MSEVIHSVDEKKAPQMSEQDIVALLAIHYRREW